MLFILVSGVLDELVGLNLVSCVWGKGGCNAGVGISRVVSILYASSI